MSKAHTTRISCLVLFVALLADIVSANALFAQTVVSGSISSNTTWHKADSPFIATESITIDEGVTLTIEAGVTIKFTEHGGIAAIGGLVAQGTESEPVVFTSQAETPELRDWASITIESPGTETILDNCVIEYAQMGLVIRKCSFPTISNSVIRFSAFGGIYIAQAVDDDCIHIDGNEKVVIRNCVISDTCEGIYFSGWSTDSRLVEVEGCTFSNNCVDMAGLPIRFAPYYADKNIYGDYGDSSPVGFLDFVITEDLFLPSVFSPYSSDEMEVREGATLTIEPGTKLIISNDLHVRGVLKAIGTEERPIVFLGPGVRDGIPYYNGGLYFDAPGNDSVLDHCIIEYVETGVVIGARACPTIQNCTIEHCIDYGIKIQTDLSSCLDCSFPVAPKILNCNISDTYQPMAIGWSVDRLRPIVRGCTFRNTRDYCHLTLPIQAVNDFVDNTFDQSCHSPLRISWGVITEDLTIPAKFSPYAFNDLLEIEEGATVVIEPGTKLEIRGAVIYGTLKAVGTEYSRIAFICNSAIIYKYMYGINLVMAGSDTIIDCCDVVNFDSGIRVYCCSPTIRNTKIENMLSYGILFTNDRFCTSTAEPPLIENCLFSDIGEFGIFVGDGYTTVPYIRNCAFNLPFGKRVSGIPAERDSDGDLMPDSWEIVYGLDMLVDDSQQDNDGDGVSNLNEYRAHTDPTDSESARHLPVGILLFLLEE